MTVATLKDMKRLGYCMRGARKFFQNHNIDWGRVRKEGISTEELRSTGDSMAITLADDVEEENGRR